MTTFTETITWHDLPGPDMPDADRTVLLQLEDGDVWPGYFDGSEWFMADGMPAPPVARWSEMPEGKRP